MAKRKILPIGVEFFDKMRSNNYYYVDKTYFIRDLLDNPADINLFTRPRRFGKTLTMTMLQTFFEKTDVDNAHLFRGLAIEHAGDAYWEHHSKYPVLFLTLRNIEGATFDQAMYMLSTRISAEADRHVELATSSNLSQEELSLYDRLRNRAATTDELSTSIIRLSRMLRKHHGETVILLIDEYDVPLDKAFLGGYYAEMTDFMRIFLGEALKSNPALNFAVLTGCLRISRESIFTGLNNMKVNSIRDLMHLEVFGFTRQETETMLADYGAAHRIEDAKGWYNGYHFRNLEMYNPWDIINFCEAVRNAPNYLPQSYWVNTSGNDIVLRFIRSADRQMRDEIERLIDGHTITKPIRAELTYGELDGDPENLWSFLLLTGYLTIEGEDNGERVVPLRIPNAEIRQIYIDKIVTWFREVIGASNLQPLYEAVLGGDAEALEGRLNALLLDTISYHDAQENFYHGFLLGILRGCGEWSMSSNAESGYGRSDILLEGRDRRRGAVIELKVAASAREMDRACRDAIAQIRGKAYAYPLTVLGYEEIRLYGIAFCGKTCRVVCEGL